MEAAVPPEAAVLADDGVTAAEKRKAFQGVPSTPTEPMTGRTTFFTPSEEVRVNWLMFVCGAYSVFCLSCDFLCTGLG